MKTVLLERGVPGGQILNTDWIDNYPGFPDGISGFDLADKMKAQADRFGLEIRNGAEVTGMDLGAASKKIQLADGNEITTQAVILATGARPNILGVPGEKELAAKGVSYCATCDGPFFRDQEIAVVGGGNTAVQEAMFLTRFAKKVTLIHRRDQLRATTILQDQAKANPKIEFLWNSYVKEIRGTNGVEELALRDTEGKESTLAVQGIFVLIGVIPNNEVLPADQLTLKNGFVVTDAEMRTNIPGVMAAGDICSKNVRQIINGAGEGAVAALSAEDYLLEKASEQTC